MISKPLAALALAGAIASATAALADGLTARLASDEIALGDSVQLTLSADPARLTAAPDISALNGDFDILGTSKSSQTRIVNGVRSDNVEWIVTLAPRATGHFTIPPLKAGTATSEALSLDVRDAAAMPQGAAAQGETMTLSIGPGNHYVQQEIPLTLRIALPGALREGAISEPESPDYILERRGEDRVSQMSKGGRPVTVIERDYLLRPQTEGPLNIAPFTLRGRLDAPNAPGAPSPFGADPFRNLFGGTSPFERMFSPGRPVTLRSAPVTLDIQARPDGAAGWFLPAKAVELSARWEPENPAFRVGEAVVRHVRIEALGASDVQLPDLETPQVAGAQVYRDKAQSGSVDTPQGTAAVRDFTFSVVPTTGGKLTLPEVTVNWFDTASEQPRVATLPAETFNVEGPVSAAPPQPAGTSPASGVDETVDVSGWNDVIPYAVAAALAALALIVLIAVGLARPWRKARVQPGRVARAGQDGARRAALRRLAAACRAADRSAAYAAALAWLRAAAGDAHCEPEDLLRRFPDLGERWAELEAEQYGSSRAETWDAGKLPGAFRAAERGLRTNRRSRRAPVLPPLYGPGPVAS